MFWILADGDVDAVFIDDRSGDDFARAIGISVFAFGGTILFEAEFRGDGVEAEEFGQDADVVGFGFGHGIEAVEEAVATAEDDHGFAGDGRVGGG